MIKSITSQVGKTNSRCIHATAINYIRDYYKILGVNRNATAKDIKTAYYNLAKTHHPDTNKSNKGAAANFQEISEAYEVLGDVGKRRLYDKTMGSSQSFNTSFTGTDSYRPKPPPKPRPGEPISMNHIQHVYKTLNREEEPLEEPKFRPFEEHNYDDGKTPFNRFEHSRHWDPEARMWVYKKRPSADRYNQVIQAKYARLNQVISTSCALLVGFILYNKFVY